MYNKETPKLWETLETFKVQIKIRKEKESNRKWKERLFQELCNIQWKIKMIKEKKEPHRVGKIMTKGQSFSFRFS